MDADRKPMYASWDGPPTDDPVVLRKRRAFLVVLILVLGALAAAGLLWRGWDALPLVIGLLLGMALLFVLVDVVAKVRARRRR